MIVIEVFIDLLSQGGWWFGNYRLLRIMNEALKTKWLWRFAIEDDALWRKIIISKYGVDRFGRWSKRSSFAHGVGCWKSILSSLEVFKTLVCFEVRNEVKVFFLA